MIGTDEGAKPSEWPPTPEVLAAAFAAGQTLAAIGRLHRRSPASVSMLAARYGLATARARGALGSPVRARRPDDAGEWSWPPSDEVLVRLSEAGIGDRRAAALFAVHPSTYRAWRRRLRDRTAGLATDGEEQAADAAEYGFDPAATWPAGACFADDPRAAAAHRSGRVLRPITIVEGASSLALLSV